MNRIKQNRCALVWMAWLPLAALRLLAAPAEARLEETFEVLETKTGTYENVTVTAKNKDWIFILHASGMGNIRIGDLPDDVQLKLGYNVPKEAPMRVSVPTIDSLKDIKLPEIQQLQQLQQNWREGGTAAVIDSFGNPMAVWITLGVALLMYLFFCYCSMMICRKAHTSPGFLIWLPVLQIIPLLRAAGMSGVWVLAFFVPVVNLVAQIVWYVKIVQARGKGPFVVLWLLLPLTTPFAFLYLAFSDAAPVRFAPTRTSRALETD